MAGTGHSAACPTCGGTWFREDKVVELDGSVMITKGMHNPAQTKQVTYQYVCVACNTLLDEAFVHGHLTAR